MKTIVIGHKNPDTDSIVSSIVAADYLKNVTKQEAVPNRAGNLNNETKFVLTKFKIAVPSLFRGVKGKDRVTLVDHNETSQIAENLSFSQVERIIDHHKVQVATETPISCRMEPIGSTSSLLFKMYQEAGKKISPTNAKLMLAGVLSDTLNLTSPTTTEEDKKIVKELNKIAKLNISEFVKEMFAAKSSLKGISIKDIISLDYKIFEMGKNRVGIGTWETTNPEVVNEKKEEIVKALGEKKQSEKLDYIFFMVVDIIKQNCFMYIITEKEKALAEKVFKGKVANDLMILSGVVSRKKQIVPPLTEELS